MGILITLLLATLIMYFGYSIWFLATHKTGINSRDQS